MDDIFQVDLRIVRILSLNNQIVSRQRNAS